MPHILSLGGSYDIDTYEETEDESVDAMLSLGDSQPLFPPHQQSFDVYKPKPKPPIRKRKKIPPGHWITPSTGEIRLPDDPPAGMSEYQLNEATMCPPDDPMCPSWEERKTQQDDQQSDTWDDWFEEVSDARRTPVIKDPTPPKPTKTKKKKKRVLFTSGTKFRNAMKKTKLVGPPRVEQIIRPSGGITVQRMRELRLARGPSKWTLGHKTIAQLKALLRKKKLKVGGNKDVLIDRLIANH